MSKVSIYLNFNGTTEQAFIFYKEVFGTEFIGDIARMGDVPPQDGIPELSDADKGLVMHVALPLYGDCVLMGTDVIESLGQSLRTGNNIYINLEPDTRVEAERLFALLSEEGQIETPLQEMFWGDYFASFTDKFGTNWMINCSEKI